MFDPHSMGSGGHDDHSNSARHHHDNSLVNALIARYGQDPSADSRAAPRPRGSHIVAPSSPRGTPAQQPHQLWWTVETDAEAARVPRPAVAGGPHLTQLALHHLRSIGLGDVAAVFSQELKSAGFPSEFSDVLRSPLQLGQPSLAHASALTQLLAPMAATRAQVRELLSTGAHMFPATVEGAPHDQMTLHHLISMCEEPMWSDVCSPTARHRVYTRPDTGAVRAAPVNALVEQITRVCVRPHVTQSEEELRLEADFRRKFFATHRHFCPSRVVLAKLFQRFTVPCALPLALQFDANNIVLDCHPKVYHCETQAVPLLPAVGAHLPTTTPEVQDNAVWLDLYAKVCKAVQVKTVAVMCEWLSMFPEHFDGVMEEALITFVHEACCMPAVPWSNTPIELAQAGEKLKLLLAEQSAAMAAAAATRSSRLARHSSTGAEHVSNRKRRNIGAPNAEFDAEVSSCIADVSSVGGGASSLIPTGGAGLTKISAKAIMIKWALPSLDESKLANQITVVDHYLLRRITPAELFAQSSDAGTRGNSSAAVRAASANVHALLRRGEETVRWLVCEIIWGGGDTDANSADGGEFDPDSVPMIVDEAGRAYVREIEKRVQIIQKIVSLAFRLIEVNNLHSAFAVFLALRHPAVLRLYDVWRNVPRDAQDNISELRELFNFDKGYRIYRDYLASMQDDDVYPVIPIVQVTVDELRRIQREPTVLLDSNGMPIVHWRKYDVLGALYNRFLGMKEQVVPAEFVALPPCVAWIEHRLNKARHADFEMIVRASLKAQTSKRTST